MIGITTKKAPKALAVVPFFLASAISFFVLSILFYFSTGDIITNFTQPKVVALTHVITLGIITMMTMGTLYQFIPVVFGTDLFSERLAISNFLIYISGMIYLVYSFFSHQYLLHLPIAASIVSISIWIFIINIILSYNKATKEDIASNFILTALFWLFITTIYGLLQAFNYRYNFLNNSFDYLKMHSHFGIIGWLLLLIIGVSSIILPMFLISHRFVDKSKIKYSFYFINAGLIVIWINWTFFNKPILTFSSWGLIVAGIIMYLIYIFQSFKYKKKKLDIAMKHAGIAFVLAILPVIFSFIIIFNLNFQSGLVLNKIIYLYAFSIFLGFYINLILGITYRTLPFLSWLFRFQKYLGKKKVPKPEQLYNSKLADIQFYIYLAMLILLTTGMISGNQNILRVSAFLMLISATLFNINVFSIVFSRGIREGLKGD